jgi:hypothetical protein
MQTKGGFKVKINAISKEKPKNFQLRCLPIYITNGNINFIDADDYMNYKMASGDNDSSQPSGGGNGGCLTTFIIAILIYCVLSLIFKS